MKVRTRTIGMAAAAVAVLVIAGVAGLVAPAIAAGPTELIVAPAGSGDQCTASAPCALPAAISAAGPADSVLLTAGAYGPQTVTGGAGTAAAPVTVRPEDGAAVTVAGIVSTAPHVTWRGLTVTGTFSLNAAAVGSTLDSLRIEGSGLFLRSSSVTVIDSLFENGSSIDGIQVGRASDVLIQGNTVRDYDQAGTSGHHADCIQVFDSSHVVIRANSLSNCYNAGIILSPGSNLGMSDITIESNFIQGCIVKSARCGGGSAVDLHEPSTRGLTVRNNTILDGSTRIAAVGGFAFDRNIVGYLANCESPMTNTIVAAWNTGLCAQPDRLGVDGNMAGTVPVVDEEEGDLHLTDPASAEIAGVGAGVPAATDHDGDPTDPSIAGADSPGTGAPTPSPTPSGPPTPTPAPTPAPSTPGPGSTGHRPPVIDWRHLAAWGAGYAARAPGTVRIEVSSADGEPIAQVRRQARGSWTLTVVHPPASETGLRVTIVGFDAIGAVTLSREAWISLPALERADSISRL
jgi:hypothetical protein